MCLSIKANGRKVVAQLLRQHKPLVRQNRRRVRQRLELSFLFGLQNLRAVYAQGFDEQVYILSRISYRLVLPVRICPKESGSNKVLDPL